VTVLEQIPGGSKAGDAGTEDSDMHMRIIVGERVRVAFGETLVTGRGDRFGHRSDTCIGLTFK
jgi:hypothetical protein